MPWYLVSIITLVAYWMVGNIIAMTDQDDWLMAWAVGLVYPLLYVLFYPVRAWKHYTALEKYYKEVGISRVQFLFGKRYKKEKK